MQHRSLPSASSGSFDSFASIKALILSASCIQSAIWVYNKSLLCPFGSFCNNGTKEPKALLYFSKAVVKFFSLANNSASRPISKAWQIAGLEAHSLSIIKDEFFKQSTHYVFNLQTSLNLARGSRIFSASFIVTVATF